MPYLLAAQLSTPDLIVLVLYVLGMVALGFAFAKKSSKTEEFMAAGRSLPGWAVGLSILGTYVSSISFLANPGKSYASNWNPFVFSLSIPIAAVIAVKFFVPFYRKLGNVSAYEHLEYRFGPWARTYAGICYLLTQLARMGTIMYLVALALEPLIDVDVRLIIIATGILVTLYTLVGGIEAVIWTDVVQSVVLTAGMLITVTIICLGMPEGPAQIIDIARDADGKNKFNLGSFGPSLAEPTFWVVLIFGLVINLQNFGIDQSYVQRYITAKSDSEAKQSVWLGALLYVPISAILFFIGTALFAYHMALPDQLPADGLAPDEAFPHFIANQLPVGLTGLLIAAIFAAAMSSVDSSLNSSATIILNDIYKRYFRKDAGEAESMRVLYATTLVLGVAGTAAALAMISIKSALDTWWKLSGIFAGGMLGLFLLGMISKRADSKAALLGVFCGLSVIVWMSLLPPENLPEGYRWLGNPFDTFLTIVFGTTTILVVGLLASRFSERKSGTVMEQPPADAP